jgi:hypothetical protein
VLPGKATAPEPPNLFRPRLLQKPRTFTEYADSFAPQPLFRTGRPSESCGAIASFWAGNHAYVLLLLERFALLESYTLSFLLRNPG